MALSAWFSNPDQAPTVLFPFLAMAGEMDGTQQTFEEVIRPGVDGIGVYYTGRRGEPFGLQTVCDYGSKAAAVVAYAEYAAKAGRLLKLYRYGSLIGTLLVHRVRLASIEPARSAINGVNISNGSSGYVLTATWLVRGV